MTTQISIIIPTYKRHASLEKALLTVDRYRPLDSEVLVVDQSPDCQKYSLRICQRYPYINYICLSTPGLPRARNMGITHTSGTIIFFMDDDAVLDPACLSEHLSYHAQNGIFAIAGRIKQMGDISWAQSSKVTEILDSTGEAIGNFDLDAEDEVLYASGGHMSVKREFLKKVGLFNPRFKGNALFEDVEFFTRARKRGCSVRYNPRAILYHYPEKNGGCHERKGPKYLTERLYNHMLYYILHIRVIPSRACLIYIKNLIEYISRKENNRHSLVQIIACGFSVLKAYRNAFMSILDNYKWADIKGTKH